MSRGLRASDLPQVLPSDVSLPSATRYAVRLYVVGLMLTGGAKSMNAIAVLMGISVLNLSRMLNDPKLKNGLDVALNRHVRRLLARELSRREVKPKLEIIVDATTYGRSSRKAENAASYSTGSKKVWGHRFTTIGILIAEEKFVPLSSLPHFSRSYCSQHKIPYRTESQMVRSWLCGPFKGTLKPFLKNLGYQASDIEFLLDAGYDNASLQRTIRCLGAHFTMMIKRTRMIEGLQVKCFFRNHRRIGWQTVYMTSIKGQKKKRRRFRIRTSQDRRLSNVGRVNVVCSEKAGGCQGPTRRYLVTTRLQRTGREILETYKRRWTVETWHKEIKQDYGFQDCSAHSFAAVVNHVLLCLLAYVLQLLELKSLPEKGVTVAQFSKMNAIRKSRELMTRINGGAQCEEFLDQAYQAVFGVKQLRQTS